MMIIIVIVILKNPSSWQFFPKLVAVFPLRSCTWTCMLIYQFTFFSFFLTFTFFLNDITLYSEMARIIIFIITVAMKNWTIEVQFSQCRTKNNMKIELTKKKIRDTVKDKWRIYINNIYIQIQICLIYFVYKTTPEHEVTPRATNFCDFNFPSSLRNL